MISSFLVEELAHLAKRLSRMTLAYYFCDDKYEERRTATAILRGLLLQLLRQQPALFTHIQRDFDVSGHGLFANFHSLWRIFASIVEDKEVGKVYCLIDALDECEKESRRLFLTYFKKLFSPRQGKKSYVKFIITSRRDNDIEEELLSANSPAIRDLQVGSGRVNGDLSEFIDVKVEELSKKKNYKSKLKEEIKHALTEKAEGTFLYVSLVLDDLKTTKILSQVRRKLEELPSNLNKVYDKILSQIDADCVETARSVLHWIAISRRPLTVKELAMARALSSREWDQNTIPSEDLLDELEDAFRCCEPLVYVDTFHNTINLVHQSAKEYLLGEHLQADNNLSQYDVSQDKMNLFVFKTCWKYLSLEEFSQSKEVMGGAISPKQALWGKHFKNDFLYDHCFLQYARQEWLEHALAADPVVATESKFRKDNLDISPRLRYTWLMWAAAGQEVVVKVLLDEGAEREVIRGLLPSNYQPPHPPP
ncbi:MAG: hypothetical protein Q9217_005304 [Psora testacea]